MELAILPLSSLQKYDIHISLHPLVNGHDIIFALLSASTNIFDAVSLNVHMRHHVMVSNIWYDTVNVDSVSACSQHDRQIIEVTNGI